MALIGALLLMVVLSTALGGMAMIAAIERRASAGHVLSLQLRLAAAGALGLAAEELRVSDWTVALSGGGSADWRRPLAPPLDLDALTQTVQRETLMEASHGADTPQWRLFAHLPWSAVSGHAGSAQTVVWVADDWAEADTDPARDSNSLILVRVAALSGVSAAWTEALCARELSGKVRVRHVRSW